jgi:hypothetical protein
LVSKNITCDVYNGHVASLTSTTSDSEAEKDMNGVGNTEKALLLNNTNFLESPAVFAYRKIFRSGKHGYHSALGEIKMVYNNKTEVNKCLMKLVGKDGIGKILFVSSTQNDFYDMWNFISDGSYYSNSARSNVLVLSY